MAPRKKKGQQKEELHGQEILVSAIIDLITKLPQSQQTPLNEPEPKVRQIIREAALKCAGISSALAIPPGPWGMATIIPDLILIWKIQSQMVADIAALYGKSGYLRKETMLYCLFKHGSAVVLKELVTRMGQRYIIRQGTLELIRALLQKIGIRLSQKLLGQSLSRFVPIVGAVGMGAYVYWDTWKIGETAMEVFSSPLALEDTQLEKDLESP